MFHWKENQVANTMRNCKSGAFLYRYAAFEDGVKSAQI
jgi:hypothetical protein